MDSGFQIPRSDFFLTFKAVKVAEIQNYIALIRTFLALYSSSKSIGRIPYSINTALYDFHFCLGNFRSIFFFCLLVETWEILLSRTFYPEFIQYKNPHSRIFITYFGLNR